MLKKNGRGTTKHQQTTRPCTACERTQKPYSRRSGRVRRARLFSSAARRDRPKAARQLQQHAALRLHRTGPCSLRLHKYCDTLYVACVARFWKVRRMVNNVSFEQIRGSLGSLLLLWSAIERAARKEVARAHDGQLPKSAHGIAAVLNAWEAAVVARQDASPLRIFCLPPRFVPNFRIRSIFGMASVTA